jgi:CTP:molybdopterin cytidylyltransferase MocA
MKRLSGIVLAAGEGRRMGCAKGLLVLEGATLIEHHVARLLEVGCTSIALVVRPGTAAAVRMLLGERPEVRIASTATSSQADSLAEGLLALDQTDSTAQDVIIITPVDMLPAQATTHHALLASLTGTTLAATPLHEGRGGHPVITRRALLAPYEANARAPVFGSRADARAPELGSRAARASTPPLREVLAKAADARRRVQVDDTRVLGDLDTPSDVRALLQRGVKQDHATRS